MPDVPPDVARDGVLHTWPSYSRTLNHVILDLDVRALADRVAATDMAVRLLHGGLDREAPPEAIVALARRTGWTLDPVPGAGHGLPIERPERCAKAVRALVATSGRAPPRG